MKQFSLSVIARAPLAIRVDHAPEGAETSKFIPGTTLIGSLAAVHRLLSYAKDAEFEELFLREAVSYPHLYPASFRSKELHGADTPVYAIPKTAQSCKRFPGFRDLGDEDRKLGEDEGHGVRDGLLDWAMFKIGIASGEDDINVLPVLEAFKNCSYPHPHHEESNGKECGATLDHLDGYYRWSDKMPRQRGLAKVDLRLQTHTGINRTSGIVQDGILYSRQVFEEGTRFWGMVNVADNAVDSFENFQQDVYAHDLPTRNNKTQVQGLVRIGTGRTRGMGKVEIAIQPRTHAEDAFEAFKQRLELFNKAVYERAERYGYKDLLQPFYFALTLHSPVILHDELLRYRGTIDGNTLAQQLGISSDVTQFHLFYQAAGMKRLSGWQELWGTPRTNEYAIDSGSVFLFSSTQGADDAWLRPLFELEQRGLGRRTAEGYGRILISDPFHREGDLL
ncbi:MAG: hypothetical protein NVSMB38_40140 [Ktedonobacteraceae bacterium]